MWPAETAPSPSNHQLLASFSSPALLLLPPLQHHSSILHPILCSTCDAELFFRPLLNFGSLFFCPHYDAISPAVSRLRPVLRKDWLGLEVTINLLLFCIFPRCILDFKSCIKHFLTSGFYLEVYNVWPYHFEPTFIHTLRYIYISRRRILSLDNLTTVKPRELHNRTQISLVSGENFNVLVHSLLFFFLRWETLMRQLNYNP